MRRICFSRQLCIIILAAGVSVAPAIGVAENVVAFDLSDGTQVTPLDSFRECDLCPEMIVVPLGSFMMGAQPSESRNPFDIYGPDATGNVRAPDEINIIPNEHPRHLVEMDIPYAIGRNEITYAQWMACVESGGCTYVPDHAVLTLDMGVVQLGPDHPVVNVSYLDALTYLTWLNGHVGSDAYRLPTEAEWEYAARSGTQTRFAQGDELTSVQANFSRTATEHLRGRDVSLPALSNRQVPVSVDDLEAGNGWGLRHMAGNVNEITLSCASETHLGLPTDSAYLRHAEDQGTCRRIAKGGAYNTAMDGLRPASRKQPTEDFRRPFFGFRVILELSE